MSIRDQLLKHKGVLTEVPSSADEDDFSGEGVLTGYFGDKEARFGTRKASGTSLEAFYSVKITKELELPFWFQNYCPLIFQEGSKAEDAYVRIEVGNWLTELARPDRAAEEYFEAQTDDSIRDRLAGLHQIASDIEKGLFPIRSSIAALRKKSILRLSFLLAGAVAVVILSVIVISTPFMNRPIHVPEEATQNSQGVLPSTRIARAQAARAMRERSIIPSNSSVFINVKAENTEVSLGEKIVLNYEVYSRHSTKCWGFYNVGSFPNFKVDRQDPDKDAPREQVRYHGKKFIKFAVGTAALSPLQAGEQIIYPGSVFITARSEAGKLMDMYLTAKPILVRVFEKTKKV